MNTRRNSPLLAIVIGVASWCGGARAVQLSAQSPTGPQTPVKTPEVIRIPVTPSAPTDTPPIPPEEIIRRFSAQEDECAGAMSRYYVYRKMVRLEELGADGKPEGRAELTTNPVVTGDGARSQRPAGEPESTLRVLNLERDDLEALSHIPLFPLVSEQVPKYDIVYAGRQPVDELMTFVFRVAPKQLDKGHAYFSGLIWVDDHDLAIVKSYGKWVSDSGDVTFGTLPFTLFETYRQPVANKYWMPAYSRSESEVMPKKGSVVPVRLTVRWDQFTPVPGNQAPPPPPAKSSPTAGPSH